MNLKELTYIVTIANEGSISAAADKLFMAQSSLSQSLQVYEAELGTPIFMRTARGVRPTASGEAFIGRARQILQSYHLAKNEVWDIEGLRGGRVEFGISTFRGTYLLPPVLKRFHELHPNVYVEITEMDSIDLEDQILKGLLDIALIAAPPVRIKSRVDPLMRDEILIVAADSHPVMALAKERTDEPGQLWVDFRDTADFEYILGPPDTVLGRLARREFRKAGREPAGLNTHISAPFAASMARAGLGLCVTYRSCIVPDPSVAYLRIGTEGVFLELGLTYPAGEYRSKAAQALGRLFHTMYSGNAPENLQLQNASSAGTVKE